MLASKQDFFAVLRQYNPWWAGASFPEIPRQRRATFRELAAWLKAPPTKRALLLSGARQIGKTTLFLQAIEYLIKEGVPAGNILYVTFDHPLLKLFGLEKLLQLWREFEPGAAGPEYLFLDEIQVVKNWQTWLKHQVDFSADRRIAVTGSAIPLNHSQESGVGRWHTIKLATLSFYEYLQLRQVKVPPLPVLTSLKKIFNWHSSVFSKVAQEAQSLVLFFHEYLLRGGFPQGALMESIPLAQRLLREDIVDKILKRDMTALFGVRRILELEQVFLYLCLHDGGLLDMTTLCKSLGLNRPTVSNFIDLLEATHLIYRLLPFGYGKQVLRGRPKIYLADPALAPSVLLKGKSFLEDSTELGKAVEAAFFKHVFTHYYTKSMGFSYWKGEKKQEEVDIIASMDKELVPFEVKYRSSDHAGLKYLKGMLKFCAEKKVERAYVITQDMTDFNVLKVQSGKLRTKLLKIPAPLACYWLGQGEAKR